MADILLLEPGYSNKYPPLGLMKISYFHKYIHGDYVRFAKGQLPEAFKDKKWDRVYVTTLFTFEWENTKKAIEYALSVVKDPTQVYTGGILATLMPELIAENFPTVKNNTGLLNVPGTLGLEGDECIDTLTPDYGILDDIKDEYVYPAHDAYFAYMTRGCGMKCGFCAVQTLEPKYIPYCSITESIQRIDEKFGPKKDLLLMDNNVLRSPHFDQIIDEIIALGFGKGATYINPKTGKSVQRYVDFNQGLDAYLLTPAKAKRLGELAIRPARIAFDHIEDVEAYKRAITLCAESGITHMSNYLLYNSVPLPGKGRQYRADTPEDLYERMHITLDLCDSLNERLENRIAIFSFPMRYIPLSDTRRGFVGTEWNAKYLRALQRMLIPTQGKGVASRSFFDADFGKTAEEFVEALAMPETHLGWRGHFVVKKDEDKKITAARKELWSENQSYLNEWKRLFRSMNAEERKEFIGYIHDNKFTVERFETITKTIHRKLFIHYFTLPALIKALASEHEETVRDIVQYITEEFPLMYKRMVEYIATVRTQYSILEGPVRAFGAKLIVDVFALIDVLDEDKGYVASNFQKVQAKMQLKLFDFNLVKYARLYCQAGVFKKTAQKEITALIRNLQENQLRQLLIDNMPDFEKKLKKLATEEVGSEYIIQGIRESLTKLNQQLTLFGDNS